ncbi:ribonuclease H-like domain-containing protein [Umbelopsis sp. AD052]|nr:ribonuclease H-like domain-containing protein [Umbelopsis sp. AD052]
MYVVKGKNNHPFNSEIYAMVLHTDKTFLLSLVATTSWRKSWEKNNWKTANNKDVQNEDLFKRLFHLLDTRPGKVVLEHVRGHQGIEGNEQADRLAVNGAILSANMKMSPDNVIK